MVGEVTDREGPEAAAAVRAWVASVLAKHSFAWQPEVTWDAERRGCTIRFRSGSQVGPTEPCFLAGEWLRDADRHLLCERDLVTAANRFAAELS
jgi:hypothetical protein